MRDEQILNFRHRNEVVTAWVLKAPAPAPAILALCHDPGSADFLAKEHAKGPLGKSNLVLVLDFDWDLDLSPYPQGPVFKGDPGFGGGGAQFLKLIEDEIVPKIRDVLGSGSGYPLIIAGYSLAGLFSLYALHKRALFDCACAVSASFWYPRFVDFAKSAGFYKKPLCICLSIGNKEKKTRHQLLKTGQDKMEELSSFYKGLGIKTLTRIDEGNHFFESDQRLVRSLEQCLEAVQEPKAET